MNEIRAQLDAAVKRMTGKARAAELEAARKEYFGRTGEVFEDDGSFELRMIHFLEWYVFDRPLSRGVAPLRAYLEEEGDALEPRQRELVEALLHHRHALLRIKKSRPPVLTLKDLWDGKTIRVEDEDVSRSFQAGDLIEARIVSFDGKNHFTEGILCHPSVAEPFIKSEIRKLRKREGGGLGELPLELAAMLLKYERYRGIKPENIYKKD